MVLAYERENVHIFTFYPSDCTNLFPDTNFHQLVSHNQFKLMPNSILKSLIADVMSWNIKTSSETI